MMNEIVHCDIGTNLDRLLAKVNALRGGQSQSQEELDTLLPSVLDRAFRGELRW